MLLLRKYLLVLLRHSLFSHRLRRLLRLLGRILDGGVLEDEYSSSGSGSIVAYGVLETLYRPNLTKDKAIDVAISGINAARRRDNYSGDGILVIYFGPNGYEWIDNEEIRARIKALGFNYPQ